MNATPEELDDLQKKRAGLRDHHVEMLGIVETELEERREVEVAACEEVRRAAALQRGLAKTLQPTSQDAPREPSAAADPKWTLPRAEPAPGTPPPAWHAPSSSARGLMATTRSGPVLLQLRRRGQLAEVLVVLWWRRRHLLSFHAIAKLIPL